MVIAKNTDKKKHILDEKKIEEIINRGAKTTSESSDGGEGIRMTLRIPAALLKLIDSSRSKGIVPVKRTQWILQILGSHLEEKKEA